MGKLKEQYLFETEIGDNINVFITFDHLNASLLNTIQIKKHLNVIMLNCLF